MEARPVSQKLKAAWSFGLILVVSHIWKCFFLKNKKDLSLNGLWASLHTWVCFETIPLFHFRPVFSSIYLLPNPCSRRKIIPRAACCLHRVSKGQWRFSRVMWNEVRVSVLCSALSIQSIFFHPFCCVPHKSCGKRPTQLLMTFVLSFFHKGHISGVDD